MISTPVVTSRPSLRVASRVVPAIAVLRPARCVQLHATYSITVKRAEGGDATFECDDDVYILDAAEEAGVDLPYSCRSGNCSTCIGKRMSGDVDQSDAMCVDDDEKAAGWTALCVGYPQSDLVVLADQEQEFMAR